MKHATIVFIDLSGSMAAYETLGNELVAAVVSKVTRWIGRVCEAYGGRVIKLLGDGVLAQFPAGSLAVSATIFMQRHYVDQMQKWPDGLRMGLKIGLASGPVVEIESDSYGDPVNIAARLCDMAGADAIWADASVLDPHADDWHGDTPTAGHEPVTVWGLDTVRRRSLGLIAVPGLAQPRPVFQILWDPSVLTGWLTMPGSLEDSSDSQQESQITLAWMDQSRVFDADMPRIQIGRSRDCDFVVDDRRVSRNHASIHCVGGVFELTDLSSYGTWVRYTEEAQTQLQLRRTACWLYGGGEIALGAPFSDFSVPTLTFRVRATPGLAAAGRAQTRANLG